MNGEIIRCVPENEVAYHANSANSNYIGIECCHPDAAGKFSDKTRAACVALAANILRRHHVSEIKRHHDITGKFCPLYYVNHPVEWAKLKSDIHAAVAPPPAPKPDEPADWAKHAWNWGKAHGITDGTRPKDNITRQEVVQMLYNAHNRKIFK